MTWRVQRAVALRGVRAVGGWSHCCLSVRPSSVLAHVARQSVDINLSIVITVPSSHAIATGRSGSPALQAWVWLPSRRSARLPIGLRLHWPTTTVGPMQRLRGIRALMKPMRLLWWRAVTSVHSFCARRPALLIKKLPPTEIRWYCAH